MKGKYFTNPNQELSCLLTLGKKSVLTRCRLPEWQICSFLPKDKPHTIQNVQTIIGWPMPPIPVTFSVLGDFFKLNCLKFTTGNNILYCDPVHTVTKIIFLEIMFNLVRCNDLFFSFLFYSTFKICWSWDVKLISWVTTGLRLTVWKTLSLRILVDLEKR